MALDASAPTVKVELLLDALFRVAKGLRFSGTKFLAISVIPYPLGYSRTRLSWLFGEWKPFTDHLGLLYLAGRLEVNYYFPDMVLGM